MSGKDVATMPAEDDLEVAIQQMRTATVEFINGKTDAWKAMCSRRDDATLFGGWGGYERGWEQLGPRYDWAAARFAGGEVAFEEIARYATTDLACTVHFERMQARLAGVDGTVPINLRVTHVYRREDDGWKLVNRHADGIVSIQAPESVIDE
jgi:ketosteroid isomerase-like protein